MHSEIQSVTMYEVRDNQQERLLNFMKTTLHAIPIDKAWYITGFADGEARFTP
jgi:hypothetical protein